MTDWPLLLLVAIDVLAVHRLTRLVTTDVVTQPPREWLISWAYDNADPGIDAPEEPPTPTMWQDIAEEDAADAPKFAALITCRWCSSVYVAALAVAAHAAAPAVWFPVAAVLALSSASTFLSALED